MHVAFGAGLVSRVREVSQDNAALAIMVEPMLAVWQSLRGQIAVLDRGSATRVLLARISA